MLRSFFFKSFCLFFCAGTALGQTGRLVVQNNSGVSRQQDPVVITRDILESFVSIPDGDKVLVLNEKVGKIPAQLDDVNGDGRWDELVFMIDIERNSRKEIKLKWVDKEDAPVYPGRTQARLGISEKPGAPFQPVSKEIRPETGRTTRRYQMDGPCWENDKVAFRYFFDNRNISDIFGKTRPGLIADSLGTFLPDFFKLQPWGMNILEVESTLGAGGIAMMDKGIPVPLRQTGTAMYRLLASGPVRSVIEITHEGWKAGGQTYNVRQRISLYAGKYWFKNEVMVSGFSGERELAVGLAALKNSKPPTYTTNNLVYSSLVTHSRQSRNQDLLGLGLLFRSSVFKGYGQTPSYNPLPAADTQSHTQYARLRIRSGELTEYQCFAGWEKSESRFSSLRYFLDLIQEEADRREFPLQLLAR